MSRSGSLYLFLHGLWVAREVGNNLEIVLPRVFDHVYKAGSWLAETPIESDRELKLIGVAPTGTDTFSERNRKAKDAFGTELMVSLPDCSLTSKKKFRFATLTLPRPLRILQLLNVKPIADGNVVRRDDNAVQVEKEWKRIATVQVLIYDYPDENEVALDGHYWEPCTTDRAISLHIISTSEGPISLAHEDETSRVLRKVIQGYPRLIFERPLFAPAWVDTKNLGDLGPSLKATGNQFITTATEQRFAFSQAELEYISARATRLGRLGRIKQQGRPLDAVWHEGDPLDDRLSNCQGLLVS